MSFQELSQKLDDVNRRIRDFTILSQAGNPAIRNPQSRNLLLAIQERGAIEKELLKLQPGGAGLNSVILAPTTTEKTLSGVTQTGLSNINPLFLAIAGLILIGVLL